MELKRILARDVKSANEKAVALYGNDVLVISSCQVRGQTELIVAVDIEPMPVLLPSSWGNPWINIGAMKCRAAQR